MSPAHKMAVKVFRVEKPGNLRNLIKEDDYSIIFTSSDHTHEERCSMCVGMRILETLFVFDFVYVKAVKTGGVEKIQKN